MDAAPQPNPGPNHLSTSHAYFLQPSSDPALPPTALLLRGVNLSSTSKYPTLPESLPQYSTLRSDPAKLSRKERDDIRRVLAGQESHLGEDETRWWSEAEEGGREGWFSGRPFPVEEADVHLRRLKAWGFTTIRYLVTWEALEHAGPGKYDEAYIDYTIDVLRKCREHGFRVFISPHQDVFSRFTSGSGAPYWVLQAIGLNPRRIHQTGSAVVHQCYAKEGYGGEEGIKAVAEGTLEEWPDMIWNTNLNRLAARHCFTMFFASETFAPKCKIDDVPVGQWLRDHFNEAYGRLADRFRDAGGVLDDCVIGWDSMNEPHEGFVGIPDLSTFPEAQSFKKGPSPTPIQGFRLGVGQSVNDIEYGDFTSTGQKTKGKITLTPPGGKGVWLSRKEAEEAGQRWGWKWGEEWDFWNEDGEAGCVWAGHGVWDRTDGSLLNKEYFVREGKENAGFIDDFWRDHYTSFIGRVRQAHPNAISFVNGPIFKSPPDISQEVKRGRIALSSHFYDGLTMLGKRRHKFNADAVGMQRGITNIFSAIKFGTKSIRSTLRDELGELKSDAQDGDGIAGEEDGGGEYPTLIGEIGTPWDMKPSSKLFGLARGKTERKDYKEPSKAMDEVLNGCDGRNALSYTLWVYEPLNTHAHGDGWNGEDLSLLSYDEIAPESNDDLMIDNPPDLSTLIQLGSRGIESWCRPYPAEIVGGEIVKFSFEIKNGEFNLILNIGGMEGLGLGEDGTGTASRSRESDVPKEEAVIEGHTLIYLPYAHYLQNSDQKAKSPKTNSRHILGEVESGPEGSEWKAGQNAKVELELEEISEGRLEVKGQWGRWIYPLRRGEGGRELKLTLRRWGGDGQA
ncbi:hypothetical protein CI109_100327 [Kwoniella shandongensis]|uniref:Uncharacterized protein n=1 Tax=Kwoniella shandongensis TaxID=1734106 RepID=A0A5M6C404_9TREE|nr:uncharacterized protein CI109_001827 [Kwoniella shandongensis]KAA5529887.1 hypothetical protein CI109_001827 [Kwoniella shandongensis]